MALRSVLEAHFEHFGACWLNTFQDAFGNPFQAFLVGASALLRLDLHAIYTSSVPLGSICTLFTVLPQPWARSARYLRYFRSLGLDLHAIYGTSDPLGSMCTLFTVLPQPWARSTRYLQYFRSLGLDHSRGRSGGLWMLMLNISGACWPNGSQKAFGVLF